MAYDKRDFKIGNLVEVSGYSNNYYPTIKKIQIGCIFAIETRDSAIELVYLNTNNEFRLCSFIKVEDIKKIDDQDLHLKIWMNYQKICVCMIPNRGKLICSELNCENKAVKHIHNISLCLYHWDMFFSSGNLKYKKELQYLKNDLNEVEDMEIKYQVCSYESSRKFKEFGIKQDSLFYHIMPCQSHGMIPYGVIGDKEFYDRWNKEYTYSAFNVAELGNFLPSIISKEYNDFNGKSTLKAVLVIGNVLGEWVVSYRSNGESKIEFKDVLEVEARAKMLVYLIENKLVSKIEKNIPTY